ncbi:nucleotide sugar dehydrogenase [Nitrincola alkalilacustris]|uniref:nucleotide sugar dehydrogenase n=1 Tax=Nitrincola alkalilacustris TaxID=1571224 RepID=UPI00124D937B|nr:nucleotide sugar dehydrogenase [Nitrincola alkalilacustris]
MKIAIWGDELAAWVAAACLARQGNQVMMVREAADDHLIPDESSIRHEPGLMQTLQQQQTSGNLLAVTAAQAQSTGIHWLAMSPGSLDMAERQVTQLAQHSQQLLIINQSNFGLGASDRLSERLDPSRPQALAYIPDTLQQGTALVQFSSPASLIIGCEDQQALLTLRTLLKPFTEQIKQMLYMTAREAEFTKFAINGMLALRLGFINELANLADQVDVDIELVRQGMGSDDRIGQHYLNPGCGFGGQHFTQYIESLAALMSDKRRSTLLETVLSENEKQKELPFRKLWQHYRFDLRQRIITLWGVAFKPGITSIDNAPALRIIDALLAQGALIRLHDPEALHEIKLRYGDHPQLTYYQDPYAALDNSDALLLITEWSSYASPDYQQIKDRMATPLIIDGRNLWEPEYLRQQGFIYHGVGRR